MPYIYDLTDGVHHYVGQTVKPLKYRYAEHRAECSMILNGNGRANNRPIYRKMIEVGPDLFEMVMLFECEEFEMDLLEYWVTQEYKSLHGKDQVLNTLGNHQGRKAGRVRSNLDWPEVEELRDFYLSGGRYSEEIGEKFGLSSASFGSITSNRRWYSEEYQAKLEEYRKSSADIGRRDWVELVNPYREEIWRRYQGNESMPSILKGIFPDRDDHLKLAKYLRRKIRGGATK